MPAATIAFAPFDNLSGDPTGDYFARGFVEDVATELSRFGTVEVLHPNAVWTSFMRGGDDDRRVQAGHIVHGSVRRAGDAVRVNVQLVEVVNGRQIWADRYDVTAGDLHAVQDEIAARIARALAVQVDEPGLSARGARRSPASTCTTAGCAASSASARARSKPTPRRAASSSARSRFDPAYARAYAGLSLSHFNEWSCQAWKKWDEKERLAYDYAAARRALDDSDAMVQVVLGRILLYRRRFDEAAYHVERALQPQSERHRRARARGPVSRVSRRRRSGARDRDARRCASIRRTRRGTRRPAGLALFVLGRDPECSTLGAAAPTSMFVDVPAFAAASRALAGD